MYSPKQIVEEIKGDLDADLFSFRSFLANYLFSAGFRVLLNYRIGKYVLSSNKIFSKQIARYYRYRLNTKRNCDISFKALIGKGTKLPHPLGIVIGDGVIVKDNVKIFQQVTIGSHGRKGEKWAYPIIENNVTIFAGAKIIGGVIIGENSVIGANSLVNKDVPPNSVAFGIPCEIKQKQV